VRIAFCITELGVGGAERCFTELVTRLDRREFEPSVYCLSGPPQRGEPSLVGEFERAGLNVHFLGGRRIGDFPRVVRTLTAELRREQPELLQTFLFHANVVGALAARRAGVRRVIAGIRVAEPRLSHLWIQRFAARSVERFVCVSQSVADYHRAGGLSAERLVVIPNGIDVNRYAQARAADVTTLGVPAGQRLWTFIGRFEPQKGACGLVRFAPQCLSRAPQYDLLMVGRGRQERKLHSMCRELGIADRVHFAGWRADIPAILRASDLLVLPSEWEGMPNVVLEAMAAGLPVVARDVEGVREVLGPESAAQVVPARNPQLFIEAVVTMLNQPRLRSEIGGRNQRRAREVFTFARMVDAYASLFRQGC